MNSLTKIVSFIFVLIIHLQGFSQDVEIYHKNEGGLPHAGYYIQEHDILKPLSYLSKENDNKVIIKLEGGMERLRYKQTVGSRNALIQKSESEEDVYYITPITDDVCELTVEVILYEEYRQIKIVTSGNKEKKELVKVYPPRKYLISYEQFKVQ